MKIRKLFADQQLSKQMGYTPQFFSFNADGGRCEECKGAGVITIEMQFMADLVLECEDVMVSVLNEKFLMLPLLERILMIF